MAVVATLSLAGPGAAIGSAHATAGPPGAGLASLSASTVDRTTVTSKIETTRQFSSEGAYYASVASPAETLSFTWDVETGVPSRFYWLHGGVPWYLHETTPGRITRENPNVNYYDLDIRVTTAAFPESPRTLKGKLTINVIPQSDGATFAAILEGSGSAWLVANGTLTDVA
ncbi:hypothetical protein AB0G04_42940 [Actinoplanes sp. NPDC023801]|uniref:hypothetical protein n=1 Tax=Actinoplanes sp. NPDC023801 TaxID=3154595 RepID=UPI0033D76E81